MYPFRNRRVFLLSLTCVMASGGSFGLLAAQAPAAGSKQQNEDQQPDDQVYKPGGDVKPPKLVHYVEPEFSGSSKEAFVEGTVKISTVITREGKPTECQVSSGLSAEEDRRALEALKQWTFQPGTKGEKPVKVLITVQIDFHLL